MISRLKSWFYRQPLVFQIIHEYYASKQRARRSRAARRAAFKGWRGRKNVHT